MKFIISIVLIIILLFNFNYGKNNNIDLKGCQKKEFIVTAYYSPKPGQSYYYKGTFEKDKKLNGNGIVGASGKLVFNGMLAAPKTYQFGTKIYFPQLGVGEIQDRGGAIVSSGNRGYKNDRIDIWVGDGEEGLKRALGFGKKKLVGYICESSKLKIGFDFSKIKKIKSLPIQENTNLNNELLFNRGLKKGDSGNDVKKLQEILKNLGYFDGNINGTYDDKTIESVYKYQLDNNILNGKEEDKYKGYFSFSTRIHLEKKYLESMNNNSLNNLNLPKINLISYQIKNNTGNPIENKINRSLKKGDSGNDVISLKEILTELGYFTGEINNIYDENILVSVFKFQKNNYLLSDNDDNKLKGYFGTKTKEKLIEVYSNFQQRKREKQIELEKQIQKKTNLNNNLKKQLSLEIPLQIGDKNEQVRILKIVLKEIGYYEGEINDIFDETTKESVLDFQLTNGLINENESKTLGGYVGPQTRKKLNLILGNLIGIYINKEF